MPTSRAATGGSPASLVIYSLAFFFLTIAVSVWCYFHSLPLSTWSQYWYFNAIVLPVVIAVIHECLVTWGGIRDAIDLFRRLREESINPLDNGAVVDHQNLEEARVASRPSRIEKSPVKDRKIAPPTRGTEMRSSSPN